MTFDIVHEPRGQFLNFGIKLVSKHIIHQKLGNLMEIRKTNVTKSDSVTLKEFFALHLRALFWAKEKKPFIGSEYQ